MKRLLALILALLLCLGVVSCGVYEGESSSSSDESSCISSAEPSSEATSSDESSTTESSSQEPTSESSSSSDNSSTDDGAENQPKKEILSGVTKGSLSAYSSLLDCAYFVVEDGITVASTYDDFLKCVNPSCSEGVEGIEEKTFEDNFIVLIKGTSGHIRQESVYYNNFKKVGDNYILTYNLVYEKGQLVSPMEYPYVDACIIPRSLCADDLTRIQVKIERKEYLFEIGKIFNSDCEVITYLPQ